MQLNTQSVDAKLITDKVVTMDNWDEVQEQAKAHGAGAFFYYDYEVDGKRYAGVCIVCPGDEYARQIPTDGSRGWSLSGPREAPSITPSIQTHQWNGQTHAHDHLWHGYMTNGRLVSC